MITNNSDYGGEVLLCGLINNGRAGEDRYRCDPRRNGGELLQKIVTLRDGEIISEDAAREA
jgi:hypothetical protein